MTALIKRRWPLLLLAVVLLLLAVGGFLYWQSINDSLRSADKQEVIAATEPELGITPKRQLPGLKRATTYLLLGSDARPGDTASRSDTILLVRVYPQQELVSVLSLPRDLWVPIPGYGDDRINAAYAYGGMPLLTETLREWAGVPIDHFFIVDFSSFAQVVDRLGGLYLPIDQDYYHYNDGQAINNWSSIDIDHGYQKVNGEDALAWVRFRHLDSDFHRAARQQIFVREAGRQIRARSLGQFREIAKVIADGTTSDLKLPGLLSLGNTIRRLPPERIVRLTMPGSGTMINGASVLLVDQQEKQEVLSLWANPGKLLAEQRRSGRSPAQPDSALAVLQTLINRPWPQADQAISRARAWLKNWSPVSTRKARRQERALTDLVDNPLPGNSARVLGCQPQKTPSGYYWSENGIRQYRLNGYRSAAAYATQSSGESVLFTWTAWPRPPILERPGDAITLDGRKLLLYWEGSALRIVAWRNGRGWAWVQNTLLNSLSYPQMIAMARNCR